MTTPADAPEEMLPPPELVLLVTDNLDPERSEGKGPTAGWVVGKPHPFMPSMIVRAMFISRSAVAIYVYSSGKEIGARDVIPMSRVRFAHERMALEVLAEEINDSAAGDDPYVYSDGAADEDDDGDGLDSTPATEPPPNGQPSP
jgi:hypothetical protein